jgi:hypothetical protein
MSDPVRPPFLDAGREAAVDRARAGFDSGAFEADLARLVAAPTESRNPERADALCEYPTTKAIAREGLAMMAGLYWDLGGETRTALSACSRARCARPS